jgi:WD40 repeat protein
MILAVGPGTPASVLMTSCASAPDLSSSSESSSSSAESDSAESENENEEAEESKMEGDEDKPESRPRARWTRRQREGEGDEDDNDSDQDAEQIVESALLEWYDASSAEEDSSATMGEINSATHPSYTPPVPSMRHGGCINTAAWLDCGWRLSTGGGTSNNSCDAVETDDCPTQLVTSGDDHLVKFWDVRHAMGMTSPVPGGHATICPFSAPNGCSSQDAVRKSWKDHYTKTKSPHVAGSVLHLATMQTGHRGNVFHVTPLQGQPGKVATCGADGFLRLTDLETGDSTIVISPEYEDDIGGLLHAGLLSLRPGMCFSHNFLNQHTGLLCSERGLRRFDIRLSPREQVTHSLLGGPFKACKACAIWRSPTSESSLEEGASTYVFGM